MEGMRAVMTLSLLAACGRFGFDGDATDAGTMSDGDNTTVDDGTVLGSCTTQTMPGIDLSSVGTTVRDIGFAQVPNGYALAFVMDQQSAVYGFQLDANLTPTSSTPVQTTPVGNNPGGYTGVSMRWDGTNLDAVVGASDNSVWLKTFTLDMNDFLVAEQRINSGMAEPSLAQVNGVPISVWYSNDALRFTFLTASGAPDGTDRLVEQIAPITSASVAAGASGTAAIVTGHNGMCRNQAIINDVTYNGEPFSSPCDRPRVRAFGSGFIAVYEVNGMIATRTISTDGVTKGAETIIGPGTQPLFMDIGSAPAIVYRTSTGLKGVDIASGNPIPGLAITAQIEAFEAAGDKLFFATAGQPRSVSCQ